MAAVFIDEVRTVEPLTPPPDELEPLLDRARGGDRRAMEDLLRLSYDRVYAVCRRIVGNDTDAADAAQEALISVAKGLARFDGRSRFTTWVYRIAVNASIDETRRRSRRKVVPFPAASSSAGVGLGPVAGLASWPAAEPVFGGEGPEDVVGMLDVEAALVALPLDYRAAVVLRDVCGLDYAEIAEVLGIPGGTVRSRIARGRGLLADRLRPDPEAEG
ncbi:MAG TPA: sigma-70 family RNA polymerase sigma factor [Acidimicrobiales bacterium]|nr:sigma-70 family RNA polymerase sigma factor [Acidimicrobiales bacterium]